jgi:uncharacterized protein YbjT (DUF2867 family)
MKPALVTVIGGTGFLGRYVVQELAQAGYAVQVISRRAHRAAHQQPLGYQTRVIYKRGDITQPRSIQEAIAGSFAVINLVGILFEKRKQRFSAIHAQCPERLAQLAREAGVKRFIHLSALGVDKATHSLYARSKATGEKAVLSAFPEATILRPSVVFGAEDNFFNQFAQMATITPALPLIGGGNTRFQPVYVGDVAKAVVAALKKPETAGKIYELGGPEILSFREILEYILAQTERKNCLITLPLPIANMVGFAGEWLPRPPLTRDQVRLLKQDNVVSAEAEGFAALGITPTAIEQVVPAYLARYRRKAVALRG